MNTEAAEPANAVDDDERTSEPDMKHAQVGWLVLDREEQRLGDIVERDDASATVSLEAMPGRQALIPLQAIERESADERRAWLSIDANEVTDAHLLPES